MQEKAQADDKVQGSDPESLRLAQALKAQLQVQIDRLTKLREAKMESLGRVKAGPAIIEEM